jgi:hypothetical protein
METIRLHERLTPVQELWLVKNVGPRMHYLHNSIGGVGWVAKLRSDETSRYWTLTFQEDKYASFFTIKFSK